MPCALITGIAGQDGHYLTHFLETQGYEVVGFVRDPEASRARDFRAKFPSVRMIAGDLRRTDDLTAALRSAQPHEVYNLAAFSAVGRSWDQAELASEVTGMAVLRLLEAIRGYTKGEMAAVKFYQASSSEMFGRPGSSPQTEETAFHPRSPYGVAKAFAHHMTVNYRESYGAFACCGILYNHESPLRDEYFVTRKITRSAARIGLGRQKHLLLGDLEVQRDWGHAADYVRAMWLMLQAPNAADYIVATGVLHSLRELLSVAFARVGIEDWSPFVGHDPKLLRPAEVSVLVGDANRARADLGWHPTVDFEGIVHEMVDADLAREGAV